MTASRNSLQLPVIQNWSCHNCGGCCREHVIEITAEEKKRIHKQNWTEAEGIPPGQRLTESLGDGRFRLAHQADGACVFLDQQGYCRIHSRFGEAAKPLACRVYPYAFHPAGDKLGVSLRFSCPSVVQNLGERVVEQSAQLQSLVREVVPAGQQMPDPPAIHTSQQAGWSDFLKFLTALEESFADDTVDFATRLMRVLSWLELVEQSRFEKLRGAKLQDYLNLLTHAAAKAQPDSDLPILRPSRTGRTMFRQLVAQLLRHDTEATVREGLRARWRLLSDGLRFTLGVGRVPALPDPVSVSSVFGNHSPDESAPRFADVETAFQGRSPEIDRLMVRYFRVKIQGMHFCGPGNFDLSLVDGFRSLALMYPATLWVARVRAKCHGRDTVELTDAQAALATIDHNFGYSPVLGMAASRKRLQILGRLQQVTRLCGWYSL